jgi:hypothetical protein
MAGAAPGGRTGSAVPGLVRLMGSPWLVGLDCPQTRRGNLAVAPWGSRNIWVGQQIGATGAGRDGPKGQAGYLGTSDRRIWSRRSTVVLPRTTFGGLDRGRRA